ncbi:hypothetical protein ACFQUU_17490 [Herbaspirillum sp. GCM10030257]|uniref:hypothetical protein n=1 Tax=Herbaspirillum sp. GCM10030257 TaxID=3273393 RepID=UPI003613A248
MIPRVLLCASALALLSACGGDNNVDSAVLSSTLVGGANAMLIEGDPDGRFGEAFIGSDGNGILLVENNDLQPAIAYYDVKGNAIRRVPSAASAIQLSTVAGSTSPIRTTALSLSAVAGSYMAIGRDNTVTNLSVASNGAIAGGNATCKIAGAIETTSNIIGALSLSIALSRCGSTDGNYRGYAIGANEYAPASFRIVAENSTSFLDMLAFK